MTRKQYYREWREKNKEHIKRTKREDYLKNKSKILKRSAERYQNVVKQDRIANPLKWKKIDRQRWEVQNIKRKVVLEKLRMEMGGKCSKCGYSEDPRILNFHHTNKDKLNNVTNILVPSKMILEAKKCILLCPNCHALTHLTHD